mgnify:CR=1 FL=1
MKNSGKTWNNNCTFDATVLVLHTVRSAHESFFLYGYGN